MTKSMCVHNDQKMCAFLESLNRYISNSEGLDIITHTTPLYWMKEIAEACSYYL